MGGNINVDCVYHGGEQRSVHLPPGVKPGGQTLPKDELVS
jgi:hypothetical protein